MSGKHKRYKEKQAEENNSSVDKKIRRLQLSCPLCPPNQGENSTRKAKHGDTKQKYKNKRK